MWYYSETSSGVCPRRVRVQVRTIRGLRRMLRRKAEFGRSATVRPESPGEMRLLAQAAFLGWVSPREGASVYDV